MKTTFTKSVCMSLAVMFSLFQSVEAHSSDNDVRTRAQIEQIIDEYVSNHPEIIVRAMKKLEENEQALHNKNIKAVAENIFASEHIPFIGNKDAKHYIIEFFDYECGYCKVMEPMFERAVAEKSLKVYYVNIPVIKQESKQLALIAQAVYNMDKKAFFRIHNLFMKPGHIDVSENSVKSILEKEGISWDSVKAQLSAGTPQEQITDNLQNSVKLNLAGTPYLIIDGQEYRGAITSYDTLMEILN